MSDKEDNLHLKLRRLRSSKSATKQVSSSSDTFNVVKQGRHELNLSEDESSDEEFKLKSKQPSLTVKSDPVLPESSDYGSTSYDFSGIIKLQADLIEARERFNNCVNSFEGEQEEIFLNAKKSDSNSLDSCSVEELLQLGEKKITEDYDDLLKSDVGEDMLGKSIEIVLPYTNEDKELRRQRNKEFALTKHLNQVRNEHQMVLHKVHLLCLIAHGNYVSNVTNNDFLYGCALSFLPAEFSPPPLVTVPYVQKLLKWFGNKFPKKKHKKTGIFSIEKLEEVFTNLKPCSVRDSVVLFVSLLRGLSLTARVVMNLNPLPLKVKKVGWSPTSPTSPSSLKTDELKLDVEKSEVKDKKKSGSKQTKQGPGSSLKKASLCQPGPSFMDSDHELDESSTAEASTRRTSSGRTFSESGLSKSKVNMMSGTMSDVRSSSKKKIVKRRSAVHKDAKEESTYARVTEVSKNKNECDFEIISSSSTEDDNDEEVENRVKFGIDYWAEVFIESEERWVSVDLFSLKVDCNREIANRCTQPISYILGWKNDGSLKDVTLRYAPTWLTKKYRIEEDWWAKSILPFLCQNYELDIMEDDQLKEILEKAPMPVNISEYKNHPLYVLQRHLLKYEAIYPQDAVPLGFVRGEPVFSRYCVHLLCSREKWRMQAKTVRDGEVPYKTVKTRSKPDKFANKSVESGNKLLELFGSWQVVDYVPLPAIDGKVPKNQYGNVEVYKPSMLPVGTVHMQVPGLLKISQKLGIDCAPAVIGWQHHNGMSHPVIDGVVVCKEYQDVLLDAWNSEVDMAEQRSATKRIIRVKKNWLRICMAVLIKERLKKKYNFGEERPKEYEPLPKLPKK